jgi:hypothetical protein
MHGFDNGDAFQISRTQRDIVLRVADYRKRAICSPIQGSQYATMPSGFSLKIGGPPPHTVSLGACCCFGGLLPLSFQFSWIAETRIDTWIAYQAAQMTTGQWVAQPCVSTLFASIKVVFFDVREAFEHILESARKLWKAPRKKFGKHIHHRVKINLDFNSTVVE